MRSFGWCVVALVLLEPAWASPARAQQLGRSNADAVGKTAALEHEARQIETMLIAPCCWAEQVSLHHSEAAEQVKREIRTMLAAGMVRQQVLDAFVERYGVRILAEPPDRGFGRILYHAPWIVGLGSVVGLAFVIRRVTRRRGVKETTEEDVQPDAAEVAIVPDRGGDAPDDAYTQRLDDELRDLD
jgi:cytochrome c-type biogenesis protein CcmH